MIKIINKCWLRNNNNKSTTKKIRLIRTRKAINKLIRTMVSIFKTNGNQIT